METFTGLLNGLWVAVQPVNLLGCFAGVFVGTLIGVLPGIGPLGAIALLLPSTLYVSPVSSLIMLCGIDRKSTQTLASVLIEFTLNPSFDNELARAIEKHPP